MIDHVNLPVSDVAAARKLYEQALAMLGVGVIAEDGDAVGFGNGNWAFGLVPSDGAPVPMHLAFKAGSHAQVEAFYKAAIAAGGRCNGMPGSRLEYGANYYACYVTDPDGHNIEAVCRD